jgi:hypothetical protein
MDDEMYNRFQIERLAMLQCFRESLRREVCAEVTAHQPFGLFAHYSAYREG